MTDLTKYTRTIEMGLRFGITVGVITLLGLMVIIYSGAQSPSVFTSGIVSIAFAYAVSSASVIHIAGKIDQIYSSAMVEVAIKNILHAMFIASGSCFLILLIHNVEKALQLIIAFGVLLLVVSSYFVRLKHPKKVHWAVLAPINYRIDFLGAHGLRFIHKCLK